MAIFRSCSRTVVLAALAASAEPSRAAIFDQDDRVAVERRAGSAYAAIGRVIGHGRAGTGFLVGACHVLTAGHNSGDGRPAIGQTMIFLATQGSSRGTIVAGGALDAAPRAATIARAAAATGC